MEATMPGEIRCVQCIQVYLALPVDHPDRVSGEAWSKVNLADTYIPTWEQMQIAPGQVMFGLVALPACIEHIGVKPLTAEQIALRSGLALPGMPG